jgi:hypothetical protein
MEMSGVFGKDCLLKPVVVSMVCHEFIFFISKIAQIFVRRAP